MTRRVKNSIYTIALLATVYFLWLYRSAQNDGSPDKWSISGMTMGTTYHIIYFGESRPTLKVSVDSLLVLVNNSLSTYIPASEISQFNQNNEIEFSQPWFYPVIEESRRIYQLTNGAFDPTVMPLVNAWGFGPESAQNPDSTSIREMLDYIGFDKIEISREGLTKKDPRIQLDLSAIAKGYGVDIVAQFLDSKGLSDHFVEIGGEVKCTGLNRQTNKRWRTGISDPRSSQTSVSLIATLETENEAVATSGNYYNYIIRNGKRFSHTISPFTGYPIEQEILSATVVTKNCMTADALATAFMVCGHQKAIDIVESSEDIEAFIIYSEREGELSFYISDQLKGRLVVKEEAL